MKKLALILMSVLLVFSCTVMAFADGETTPYAITVTNPIEGETYTAYKIFEVSKGVRPGTTDAAIAYSISAGSEWWTAVTTPANASQTVNTSNDTFTVDGLTFTKTALTDGSGNTIYNVTHGDSYSNSDAAALAAKLYGYISGKTPAGSAIAAEVTTGEGNEATTSVQANITNLPGEGYYFVTTSTGALCALSTAAPTVNVTEKNDLPQVEKKVSKKNGSQANWVDSTNASMGDTVYFKITVTDGNGTDKAMTVTDVMSAGLTLDPNSIVVTRVGNPDTVIASGEDTYAIPAASITDRGFTINFAPAFVTSLPNDAEVVITYSATLNENAVIYGNTDGTNGAELQNTNTATLTYSAQTFDDTVNVNTFKFEIVKTTSARYGSKLLDGAMFKLYDAATGGDEIPVVRVGNTGNVYRLAGENETGVEITAGLADIVGLGNGTYYLEEIEAPAGYNKLSARQEVTISNGNLTATLNTSGTDTVWESGGVHIENLTGTELPSTGGIGTYLFYGIGALLVVGAVVVLVSKKRMRAYEA